MKVLQYYKHIIIVSIYVFSVLSFSVMGFYAGKKSKTRIVHVDLEIENQVVNTNHKYPFLPKEKSDYIENLSNELGINPNLSIAILMRENPEFNPDAEHKNENGTIDIGFFQLNSKYIYTDFEKKYWLKDGPELNPYNWKHNTFIALHLLQDLQEDLKIQDDVICAYNCGTGPVLSHNIPNSTINYLAAVRNNLILLEEFENVRE